LNSEGSTLSWLQAVALVFEHVGSAHETPQGVLGGEAAEPSGETAGGDEDGIQRKRYAVLAQQGAANAALKLLDDLCMMATGNFLSVL
jgi:hypothetical protein